MIVTQNYAGRSAATLAAGSLGLNLTTETGRPPVRLHATVLDGPAYARLMKTLYALVTSNLLTPKRDRGDYFEWVRERYLEELSAEQARTAAALPVLFAQRDTLQARLKEVETGIKGLVKVANSADYWAAVRRYYDYLYRYDRDAWYALDPVVSVHPDCIVFEAFSQDESSYGRVTVPLDRLDVTGAVDYGTTNIDFSPDLAREIGRIRSYRATDLHVGPAQVALATTAGSAVEKKIDLPPTWVRGFLQVQSAATLPGVDVRLSASTLADVLSVLRRRREDRGPRSLRVVLAPSRRPSIVVEPWGTIVDEHTHVYDGRHAQEIRLWGRRRLLVLEELLPYAREVRARLLGTGMPSYWSVFQGSSRIDIGLSGWTQNDWSRAAQFDLLASLYVPSAESLRRIAAVLEERLVVTAEDAAMHAALSREEATSALQGLCREGRAMYDYVSGAYRWRQLFPFMPEPEVMREDPRLAAARRLLDKRAVTWSAPPQRNAPSVVPGVPDEAPQWRNFAYKDAKSDKFWNILLTGASYVVHFGRTGTDGQRQQKDFATEQAAKAAYEKIVKEKTGRGYRETTPPAAPVPTAGPGGGDVAPSGERTRYTADVKGEKTYYGLVKELVPDLEQPAKAPFRGKNGKLFLADSYVMLDVDTDGRVAYAQCTCGAYRRDKLRKGPCAHILAVTVAAARHAGTVVTGVAS